MKYFLQRDGRSFGPYSFDDLKRYQTEGRIGPEDNIRAEDSERWVPQTEFFNPPAAAAPVAPVFTPPAPVFIPPAPAPQAPAPNPFAAPTDVNPVWNAPAPTPQPAPQFQPPAPQFQPPAPAPNPFAAPGANPNPFGAPPAAGFGGTGGFGGGAPAPGGFGGPPSNPGFGAVSPQGAPAAAPSNGWPSPPDMQWYVVLLIGMLCGLFPLYHFFLELSFVKKIDPASKAMKMILGGWGVMVLGVILGAILSAMVNESALIIPMLLGMVCYFGGAILAILGIFNMRASIERHYNTVENIGLKLSPVMTFFFSVYYFQYHFARIANWKKTGRFA